MSRVAVARNIVKAKLANGSTILGHEVEEIERALDVAASLEADVKGLSAARDGWRERCEVAEENCKDWERWASAQKESK